MKEREKKRKREQRDREEERDLKRVFKVDNLRYTNQEKKRFLIRLFIFLFLTLN